MDVVEANPMSLKVKALLAYQTIERALFAILVTELGRDPIKSLQIIALWIWLEQVDYGKVTRKIFASATLFINQTVEEAIMCLKCIKDPHFISSTEAKDIPLTRSLLEKDISLRFFHYNRVVALREVGRIIGQNCVPSMRDIIQNVVAYTIESSSRNQEITPFSIASHQSSSSSSSSNPPFCGSTQVLGPNRRMRVSLNANAEESSSTNQLMNSFSNLRIGRTTSFPRLINYQVRNYEVPPEDRTLFLTFSRGYPVTEREVRYFMTRVFGNCIESFDMQETRPHEQPLYALVVLFKPSFLQAILDGEEKSKFSINGKHVWMRKFIPRKHQFHLNPC